MISPIGPFFIILIDVFRTIEAIIKFYFVALSLMNDEDENEN